LFLHKKQKCNIRFSKTQRAFVNENLFNLCIFAEEYAYYIQFFIIKKSDNYKMGFWLDILILYSIFYFSSMLFYLIVRIYYYFTAPFSQSLAGKRILLLGNNSQIDSAICTELSKYAYSLHIIGPDKKYIEFMHKNIVFSNVAIFIQELDIKNCTIEILKKTCDSLIKNIDLVIINTGTNLQKKKFLKSSFSDIQQDVNENYLPSARLLHYFSERMARKRSGNILVICEENSIIPGFPGGGFSSGSALWALCQSAQTELSPLGINLQYFPINLNEANSYLKQAQNIISGLETTKTVIKNSNKIEFLRTRGICDLSSIYEILGYPIKLTIKATISILNLVNHTKI